VDITWANQGFESPRLQNSKRKFLFIKKIQLKNRVRYLIVLVTGTEECW